MIDHTYLLRLLDEQRELTDRHPAEIAAYLRNMGIDDDDLTEFCCRYAEVNFPEVSDLAPVAAAMASGLRLGVLAGRDPEQDPRQDDRRPEGG